MTMQFSNNASGTNSVQVEIIDTTITLQTNEGQLFPAVTTASGDFFYATLEDTAGNVEIVRVTDNTADVLTVTRAQENTVARVFAVGSKVEQRTTAATLDEFIQRTGGTMTGTLDMDLQTLQDANITNPSSSASLQGMPLRGSDNGTANQIVVPAAAGAPLIGINEIWHQGNDGPGTGLDADTLDGVEGAGYIKPADATVGPSGDWTFSGDVTLDGDVTTADFGTGGRVKDGADVERPVGFNVMPILELDTSATFSLASNGYLLHKDTVGAADWTCPNDADIPAGATWIITIDAAGVGAIRIKGATGVTVKFFDQINEVVTSVTAGNGFTLTDASVATLMKYDDLTYFLWGGSITTSP